MELVLAVECGVGSALDGLVLIDRDTLTDAPPTNRWATVA